MTDKERKEFLDAMIKSREDMVRNNDKKLAMQILYDAGLITKKGKIRKGKEGVCMLLGQGLS